MESHRLYLRAFTAADREIRDKKDHEKVIQIWIFLGSVLAFFTFVNVVRKLVSLAPPTPTPSRPTPSTPIDDEKVESGQQFQRTPRGRLSRAFSSFSAAWRIFFFRYTVLIGPSASALWSELGFIFVYITVNLLCTFVDTWNLRLDMYKTRSAMIASCQLPLVTVLASKNNIVSWLTGVSHEKLNVLHRASARTIFVLLWIHALGRGTTALPPHAKINYPFMIAGILGLVALTLAAILSLPYVRNRVFELFYVSHVVFIAMFLIGGFIHLDHQGMGYYVWPAMLLWGLDRLYRLTTVIGNNFIRPNKGEKQQATVELITSDTIRLTFRRKFSWKPGQHAYITVPKISKLPSEAHPFTIATIPTSLDGSPAPAERDVVFLIRARNGFTRHLKEYAVKGEKKTVTAIVDGPYGLPPTLHQFSTCILVAGGSGISYTLPLLLDLISRSNSGKSLSVRRVLFIWSVRGEDNLPWITEELENALKANNRNLDIQARLFITSSPTIQPSSSQNSITSSLSKSQTTHVETVPAPSSAASQVMQIRGRPSLTSILHEEIQASTGPVSVDVAGPGEMVAAIRDALSTGPASPGAVLKGSPSVTLHVETFGMTRK